MATKPNKPMTRDEAVAAVVQRGPWATDTGGEETPIPWCLHCGATSWAQDINDHHADCPWIVLSRRTSTVPIVRV